MNRYEKRVKDLELRRAERARVPVIIAEAISDENFLWNGKKYTMDELKELQKKNQGATLIINDIPELRKEIE